MAGPHDRHNQLAIGKRVCDALRLSSSTALYRQLPRFGGAGYQRMVGTAAFAPVAVLIGPLRHSDRIYDFIGQ